MGRPRQHTLFQTTARVVAAVVVAASLSAVAQAPVTGAEPPAARTPLLDRQDETGKVGFIGTRAGQPIDSGFGPRTAPATVARSVLNGRAAALGLRGSSLDVLRTQRTPNHGTAVRLEQTYRGVPVLGGQFVVNLDEANDVLSVLGEASPISAEASVPSTRPSVSAAAAGRTAVASVAKATGAATGDLQADPARLMFYDPRLLSAPGPFQHARLAWVTDVRGTDRTTDIGWKVVVDAAIGSVALSFETIEHALDRSVCDANNLTAEVPCENPVWTEGDTPAGEDADVQPAYDYSGDTYDFFFDRFGRDSLDGAGLPLVSTIDYCDPDPSVDCPYLNAFWNGEQMVYGDGFAAADDVVGHELTHGFTDFSSSLFYYMQSGAINESMSDVFGELIDQTNGSGTDTPEVAWQMGEDVPGFGVIRNMADPTALGDPDRMLSDLYYDDPFELDSGGVHINSGVNNKAAFLMVEGGTFNGQTITGIGITKTARLYYTVNDSMLVSGSDYADLANALRQACTNLVGVDGITVDDCDEVDKVVLATEMDQDPMDVPTTSATACPTGSPVSTVLSDDLETDIGQFTTGAIAGPDIWAYPQVPNIAGDFDATYATSGDTNAWGYDAPVLSDSFLRMTSAVSIPANAYLTFNHAYGFEDDSGGTYDGGVVEYSTSGAGGPWVDAAALFAGPGGANGYTGTIDTEWGNPLAGRSAFVGESFGYGTSRASLTSLAGQDVTFRWRIGTDALYWDYGWFLDDIRIVTCDDITPPDTTITSGLADGSTTSDSTPTFGFTSSEAGSVFECSVDGAPFALCTSPFTLSGLGIGAHTFAVRAIDAAGNTDATPASRAFTVNAVPLPPAPPADTTAPDTSITAGPSAGSATNDSTPTFAFGSSEAGSTFQCRVDAGSFGPCTSPFTTGALAEGSHTFEVRATDGAGNADASPASVTFTVDLTAPDTSITSGPGSAATKDATPTFGFASTETGSTFQCRIDAGAFGPCASPFTASAVADGAHTFEVRAVDAAGNADASAAARPFTVDTTAPETTITSQPKKRTASHRAAFAFAATEAGSTFMCRLDDQEWGACTSPTTYRGLSTGRHVLRVYAVDAAGNVETTRVSWTWRIIRG